MVNSALAEQRPKSRVQDGRARIARRFWRSFFAGLSGPALVFQEKRHRYHGSPADPYQADIAALRGDVQTVSVDMWRVMGRDYERSGLGRGVERS